jgi:hypothetical protein
VRAERARKKKLIVAFHFQFSNPRGWNCDECRENNLEIKRRCAWVPAALLTTPRPVWIRNRIHTDVCPKSIVQAQSLGWIEEYAVWRRMGGVRTDELSAKQVDAYLVLEAELRAEQNDGTRATREGARCGDG